MVALRRARARRDFFQRIDQQYLAKELSYIPLCRKADWTTSGKQPKCLVISGSFCVTPGLQVHLQELKDIAKSGRDGELPDATLFDPKARSITKHHEAT